MLANFDEDMPTASGLACESSFEEMTEDASVLRAKIAMTTRVCVLDRDGKDKDILFPLVL